MIYFSELGKGVTRKDLFSELLMCGEGSTVFFLLYLVARSLETVDVCIWRMFVLCLLHVCVRGVMDVVFSVCIVMRGAVGARVWEV